MNGVLRDFTKYKKASVICITMHITLAFQRKMVVKNWRREIRD